MRSPAPVPLAERVRNRLAPAFDTAGGQRLNEVLVNLLIVGFAILFAVGALEAVLLGRPSDWAQPVATAALMAWAWLMKTRNRPEPVRLLMVAAAMAAAYLWVAAATGSLMEVTNTSPVVMMVGAGAIALAAGGSRPTSAALSMGLLSTISVVAVQSALGEHPMAIMVEAASVMAVVALAYYLVRSVRVAYETGSSRYAGLVETAPVAVLEADLPAGGPGRPSTPVIRNLNPRAREILGIGDRELQGVTVSSMQPAFRALLEGIATGSTTTGEQVVTDSGRSLLVSWRVLGGDRRRVILSAVDITSQQEAERSLAEQVRSRDQFIATVSHELRTPLTGALGLLELIHTGGIDEHERNELMGLAISQTRDMADIVQDLLVAARAPSGGLVIRSEPMALAPVVEEVVASLPGEFSVEHRADPVVEADAVRVRQIVRNLATNAVRYGGPSRHIRIGAGPTHATVEVLDDGPPLDPTFQARMFDPYERSGATDLPTESVGLGLTVARTLARLLGGDLTYRHDGSASVFCLTLPIARPAGDRTG